MWAAMALALVALLAHAWSYRFQCDDAFISFRYARNLAHGAGLVFNPGLERVEGYTDFLWVLLLASMDRLGVPPERAADALSLASTVALWALVAWFAARKRSMPSLLAVVPVLLLAATRSVAVWSTSGLETRLFEVLILSAILRCAVEMEPLLAGASPRRAIAGWLFGLAALTRPEGLLVGLPVALVSSWQVRARGRASRDWLVATLSPFLAIVVAHVAFRRIYYGAWLPNTYYAKVGGQLRFGWGTRYVAAFALEYAAYLWLPLLVLGARRLAGSGRGTVPALFATAAGVLLVYVAAIGGDHFEYRPLDVMFPIAFLTLGQGFAALAERPRGRLLAVAAAIAVVYGLVDLPARSHREFPERYLSGFPGGPTVDPALARDYLAPGRDPLLRFPGLSAIAGAHAGLTRYLTSHFVAVRQEEHRLFLAMASAQGRRLRALVEAGLIPRDTRIAIDCVGAIPYYSDLRVLDRHGLTDAVIARRPSANPGVMAHEKAATHADGRRFGVELWSESPTDLVLPITSTRVLYAMTHPVIDSLPVVAARVPGNGVLLCMLLEPFDQVAARMPALRLTSVRDTAFQRAYVADATPAYFELLRRTPGDIDAMNAFAYLLLVQDRLDEALVVYTEIARLLPADAGVWERLAACQQQLGMNDAERRSLAQALALARASGDGARTARVAARLQALGAAGQAGR